jgi:hypothetical protein
MAHALPVFRFAVMLGTAPAGAARTAALDLLAALLDGARI